jgi:hypothetical protein
MLLCLKLFYANGEFSKDIADSPDKFKVFPVVGMLVLFGKFRVLGNTC